RLSASICARVSMCLSVCAFMTMEVRMARSSRDHPRDGIVPIRSGFIAARVSATLKGGGDPVGRQQGNLRLDADYRVGVESEAIPLPNGGKNDRCFHQGKTVPHT